MGCGGRVLQGGLTATRKLRVAYMLPHHNITGGMKCLVEHIRLLRERGHTTIAVHRCAFHPWRPRLPRKYMCSAGHHREIFSLAILISEWYIYIRAVLHQARAVHDYQHLSAHHEQMHSRNLNDLKPKSAFHIQE